MIPLLPAPIPEHTKHRIIAAARELNYRPNYFARSLRLRRTYTIGVIAEEIGDPYGAMVISGVEEYLRKNNYFFLTVIHRHDQKILQAYSQMLLTRGVEGFITTDTSIKEKPSRPTVAVAGHERVKGVTNIILDEKLGARLALTHLAELGHENIAFLKGDQFSSDSSTRWNAICEIANELGIRIRPELTVQIDSTATTPTWVIRSRSSYWRASIRSQRFLLMTTFRRSAPCGRSAKPACASRKTFLLWDSTTFLWQLLPTLRSPRFANHCSAWGKSRPRP